MHECKKRKDEEQKDRSAKEKPKPSLQMIEGCLAKTQPLDVKHHTAKDITDAVGRMIALDLQQVILDC